MKNVCCECFNGLCEMLCSVCFWTVCIVWFSFVVFLFFIFYLFYLYFIFLYFMYVYAASCVFNQWYSKLTLMILKRHSWWFIALLFWLSRNFVFKLCVFAVDAQMARKRNLFWNSKSCVLRHVIRLVPVRRESGWAAKHCACYVRTNEQPVGVP